MWYTATRSLDDSGKIGKLIGTYLEQWHENSTVMAIVFLTILSISLTVAYATLMYNLRKYYRDSMQQETRRLTVLFATFCFAYWLRLIYSICSSQYAFANVLHNMATRWGIINVLPIVWDISSILSILILHSMSFRSPSEEKIVEAGHNKRQAGLPDIETVSSYSEHDPLPLESKATTCVYLQRAATSSSVSSSTIDNSQL